MYGQVALVDEATLSPNRCCTFCIQGQGPFVEIPLPAQFLGAAMDTIGGAVYICLDHYESVCEVGGHVSIQRLDEVLKQSDEHATFAAGRTASDHQYEAKIAGLEKERDAAQNEVASLRVNLERFQEIFDSLEGAERREALERIAAFGLAKKTKSRPKAAA